MDSCVPGLETYFGQAKKLIREISFLDTKTHPNSLPETPRRFFGAGGTSD